MDPRRIATSVANFLMWSSAEAWTHHERGESFYAGISIDGVIYQVEGSEVDTSKWLAEIVVDCFEANFVNS
jgi:hypothetical protein